MKSLLTLVLFSMSIALPGISQADTQKSDVADGYGQLAYEVFSDSLSTARALDQAIKRFLDAPSEPLLREARQAWVSARVPYQQSEVFRFGNPVVDDWEGQVNAWPLDEGLIDYVDTYYQGEMGNFGAELNIVASPVIELGDVTIDTQKLTPSLLADLNELGGSEANVATGYHAIEFLLWGQDLNGTGPGAGNRPYTDYVIGSECTHGHCDRRSQYLRAASQLLVQDLEYMVDQWSNNGDYRQQLSSLSDQEVLTRALYGMGSLSLGELAGERMKVSLEAHSPEDEHDCFSDNTHNSHYYDGLGIRNVYLGQFATSEGRNIQVASLSDLIASINPTLDQQLTQALNQTQQALQALVDSAESGNGHFDQLIAEGNQKGRDTIISAINALVEQTQLFEEVASALGIDNLNPDTADHDF